MADDPGAIDDADARLLRQGGGADFELRELRAAAQRMPGMWRLRVALAATVGLVFLQFTYAPIEAWQSPSTWGLLLCLLVLLLTWWIPRASMRRLWRRIERAGGEVHFMFGEQGLAFSTGGDRTDFSWSSVRRFQETEDDFFVYTNRYTAQIVPKGPLSAQDLRALRALLRRHAPSRPHSALPLRLLFAAALMVTAFAAWALLERPQRRPPPPQVIIELSP